MSKNNKNIEPNKGTITTPMNVTTKEFKEFQLFLSNKAKSLDRKQKLNIELLSLQIKNEDHFDLK